MKLLKLTDPGGFDCYANAEAIDAIERATCADGSLTIIKLRGGVALTVIESVADVVLEVQDATQYRLADDSRR